MNCFDFRLHLEFSGCEFRGRLDPCGEEGGGKAKIIFGFFSGCGFRGRLAPHDELS